MESGIETLIHMTDGFPSLVYIIILYNLLVKAIFICPYPVVGFDYYTGFRAYDLASRLEFQPLA